MVAVPESENETPRLGINEGGWHAAEGLILARYFMFTQVYFHKTRVAYDHHLQKALAEMLPGGVFPLPHEQKNIEEYLKWDDWRVLGLLAQGKGGDHGKRLADRNHFRLIRETPETPTGEDIKDLSRWREALGELLAAEKSADKSWYKVGKTDIPVVSEAKDQKVKPLSKYSSFVAKIEPIKQVRLYVRSKDLDEANQLLNGFKE